MCISICVYMFAGLIDALNTPFKGMKVIEDLLISVLEGACPLLLIQDRSLVLHSASPWSSGSGDTSSSCQYSVRVSFLVSIC